MKKNILYIILSLGFLIAACTDMNDVSKKFLTEEIRYAGSPDTIHVYSGNKRVILHFKITDATVSNLTIYWNNRSSVLNLPVNMDVCPKTFNIEIPNLTEGSYSFEIVTKDTLGNNSIFSRAVGKVYGDEYYKYLLNTPLKAYRTDQVVASKIEAAWGTPDLTALGMEFIYTNTSDQEVKLYVVVPKQENVLFNPKMQLDDYKTGTNIKYRTYYLPEVTSVDTFITSYKDVKVKGVAVNYDRSIWTISGKYDLTSTRMPQNLLDGDPQTIWHADKTVGKYPHSVIVDMGKPLLISGFYIQQRPQTPVAKTIAFRISNDGINWSAVGEYTLPNTTLLVQRLDLQIDVTARYFELILKADYSNSTATGMSEVGTYLRPLI